MADFSAVTTDYNSGAGTDASPVWTGTTMAMGGSGGANEARWQRTGGGGTTSTSSANWPYVIRPGANAAVEECYIFTADTTGLKVTTYDGSRTASRMFRLNFDNLGSPASKMQFSAFQDTSLTTPTPGTQTAQATDGRNIINGHATDTSSTAYLKGNVFGTGFPSGGAQETPAAGAAGTTLAATSGTAGSVSPSAAAFLTTWQSLQGWTQYITAPSIAASLTAFYWYFVLALYVGPNMQTGTFVFCPWVIQYTYT
jgi:hypothetical protein